MARFIATYLVVLIAVGMYWTFAGPWSSFHIAADTYIWYDGRRIHFPFGTALVLAGLVELVLYGFGKPGR